MQKNGSFLHKSTAFWLPLLLFGLTYLIIGFHYETNDDLIISLLLRGIAIQPPISNLVLYFHGLSQGLVLLYKLAPQWPWYGLVLYALLYIATAAAILFLLRSGLDNSRRRLVWLLLFFLAGWAEHIYWFNYMRVPLLLAGTSFLLLLPVAANQKNKLVLIVAGLLFLTALCIRPSAALLGVAVVGPAVFLLTAGPVFSWRKFLPVFWYAFVVTCFFIILSATQTPAEKQYRRLDWLKSTVLDFQIYKTHPRTESDTLAFGAIKRWFLADTQVINEAFYHRAGNISLGYILAEVAPFKLPATLGMLVRDHFLILALNAVLLFLLLGDQRTNPNQNRKLLLAYQFYFWLLILGIGIFLKLPPRVITPCLSLYTMVNASCYLKVTRQNQLKLKWGNVAGMVLLLLAGLQLYKISHRARWQQQNQQANEAFISALGKTYQRQILVTNVLPDYFRSLTPLRQYDFGSNYLFFLTGWSNLDPANRFYFKKLTGQPDFAGAVAALSRNNNTTWLLSPGFYGFMKRYYKTFYQQEIYLQPAPATIKGQYPVQTYRAADNLL